MKDALIGPKYQKAESTCINDRVMGGTDYKIRGNKKSISAA